jgi:alanine racemase
MLRRYAKHALRRLTSNDFRPLNHIELSRANMLQNVALVQRQHPGAEIIPVLKGNAYGHGIEQVAEILHSSPVRWLAVDGYFEAAKIRDVCKQRLLVLGYIRPENTHLLDSKRCSFAVQDIAGLRAFGALGKPVRIHLELNTGMNRLGLQTDELDAYLSVLREYPKLELEGVMSHLADADNADSQNFSHYQSHRFDTQVAHILAAGFTPKLIHLANTAGSVKAASKYANAARRAASVEQQRQGNARARTAADSRPRLHEPYAYRFEIQRFAGE